MGESWISQLMSRAWGEIGQAVSEGLAGGSQRKLSDVLSVVTGRLHDTTWQADRQVAVGGGLRLVCRSATSASFDYQYRFTLSDRALAAPDIDAITAWAASARQFELQHVVGHLADQAMRYDFTAGHLDTATADGWGQLRCVTFRAEPGMILIPGSMAARDWDGPVRLDLDSPRPPIQALLFRLGGGPYVRRPADLALTWASKSGVVDLVLAGQLQVVNAVTRTITGIHMVEGRNGGSVAGR